MPISKSDICDILPDVSPTTIEAVLSKMVKGGQIKKIGQSRRIEEKLAKMIAEKKAEIAAEKKKIKTA